MIYDDIVYGQVEISEPVILELMQSPEMQRLKGIEQSGYYEPHFPQSKHSRFEHSIGVYLLLKKYGASLEEQIAGLVHDISHATFSHCIDYVLPEGSSKEQSHQDNIFEDFIKNTDISDILKKYGLDINYIVDDSHFPLKETLLPDLCADRIDYSLRGAIYLDKRSPQEVKYFLDHLQTKDGKWVFDDLESAKNYAELFLRLNELYYASIESAVMHRTVGDCLKYALGKGYINKEDFYTTDDVILNKIKNNLEHDQELQLLWDRMNNKIAFENNPDDYQTIVHLKSRVVDPLFMDGNQIKRVSDVDTQWKEIVKTKIKPKEYFLKFEK